MKFSKLFVASLVISSLVICQTTYSTIGGKTIAKKSSSRKTIGAVDSETLSTTPFKSFSTVAPTGYRGSLTVTANQSNTDAIYVLCVSKGATAPTQAQMIAYGFKLVPGAIFVGSTSSTNIQCDVYGVSNSGSQLAQFIEKSPGNAGPDSVINPGSVTANAGTNLNTSLLALETGGNLATAATKLTTIASNGATASNQTNGSAQTKITDGTNIAGVVPGIVNGVTSHSGMVQYTLSSTGSQSANTPLPITVSGDATRNPTSTPYIDTTGYSSVAVTVVSIGSGVTNIERYGANRTSDTFYPESILNISSSAGSSIGVTMGSTATIYTGGLASRFLQFQSNGAQSSGTTTIIVTLRSTIAYQPVVQLAQGSNPIGGLAAVTSGGMSSYAPLAGLPSSPTVIKGSAGSLYTVDIYNPNATIEYVAFYNTSSITYSSTVPIYWFAVSGQSPKTASFTTPWNFSSTIYCVTSSTAPGGTLTAPGSALLGSIGYF